ncbi:hypothetical protein ACMGDK_18680 [Chryseobacterium sp. DT-3]|uniref:hypothetical protein n=1 Tax=Chryseobacterium sp. DT-3 TaxID=3396164 RepID=UPI003F1A3144
MKTIKANINYFTDKFFYRSRSWAGNSEGHCKGSVRNLQTQLPLEGASIPYSYRSDRKNLYKRQ